MAVQIYSTVKDLGGFNVTRWLPNKDKRMVGPFVFLDHMGPAHFKAGEGVNVRPHPHIGLSTLTYLFTGSMLHRDSLGSVQEIHPGEVNWMTAGSGITHSERETIEVRAQSHQADGLQFWIALPPEKAEIDPSFQHVKREALPHRYSGNTYMRLIAGNAYGMSSPVQTHSPLFLLDILSKEGDTIIPPYADQETAVYIQSGALSINAETFSQGDFVLLEAGEQLEITAASRLILFGGAALAQTPYIRWNFVAYSRERIQQAEEDWRAQRFPKVPGDEAEYTPLPS